MHVGHQRKRFAKSSLLILSGITLAIGLSASVSAATALPGSIAKDINDGYFHRALARLQVIRAGHANDAEYQFELGEALLGSNQPDKALKAMQAAVKIEPDNGIYHRGLGDVYGTQAMRASIFSQLGLARDTLHEYQQAVTLAPDNVVAHVSLAMYYIVAPGIAGGSTDKAHEQEAILDKSDPVQALLVRAREASGNKDMQKAERLFRQATDKSSDGLNSLGFFYIQRKRYDDALKAFHATTDKDAKNYQAWYQIGLVAGLLHGHDDEGIAALKRYLSAPELPDDMPTAAWAHLLLGNLYEDQGNTGQTQTEYQQADKLKGDDKNLAKEMSQKKF
jgi:tetratricopeptide (TPR) repeat protein